MEPREAIDPSHTSLWTQHSANDTTVSECEKIILKVLIMEYAHEMNKYVFLKICEMDLTYYSQVESVF